MLADIDGGMEVIVGIAVGVLVVVVLFSGIGIAVAVKKKCRSKTKDDMSGHQTESKYVLCMVWDLSGIGEHHSMSSN